MFRKNFGVWRFLCFCEGGGGGVITELDFFGGHICFKVKVLDGNIFCLGGDGDANVSK